ncbi:MAG: hypothetical protein PHC62_07280, partial [Candidatus Izemoplasmatales bacterium]|nr:hypothetical protein [Candidatus Izemoplasmatales bacterium]
DKVTVIVPLKALVDIEEEKEKILDNKKKVSFEIERAEKMLNNHGFLNRAPESKINEEKEKLASYRQQLIELEKLLKDLS